MPTVPRRPWVIPLWLVLFAPVGIALVWLRSGWTQRVKVGATAAACVWMLALIAGNGNKPQESTSPTLPNAAAAPASTVPKAPIRPLGYVTRAEYGKDWPLSVPAAVVGHDNVCGVIAVVDGVTYGVNGTARGEKSGDGNPRYADILKCPKLNGKGSLGLLIDKGLTLPCADAQ